MVAVAVTDHGIEYAVLDTILDPRADGLLHCPRESLDSSEFRGGPNHTLGNLDILAHDERGTGKDFLKEHLACGPVKRLDEGASHIAHCASTAGRESADLSWPRNERDLSEAITNEGRGRTSETTGQDGSRRELPLNERGGGRRRGRDTEKALHGALDSADYVGEEAHEASI